MNSIKRYMDEISKKGIKTNKSFWNFIEPSTTDKGMIASNGITLTEGKIVIRFQRHLTNTVLTLSKKVSEINLIK